MHPFHPKIIPSVIKDNSHPANHLFQFLRSGKRPLLGINALQIIFILPVYTFLTIVKIFNVLPVYLSMYIFLIS